MTAQTPGPQQQPATWDSIAATYAEDVGQWRTIVDECLRRVPLAPTSRVLDVASGPGTLALVAAPNVARVLAVDFSPGMIAEVRERAAERGLTNVEASVMDAQALAFPDASFDAAFCLFGFFFFPDRARAFREMLRVLVPGGRALIATWAPIDRRPIMKIGFDAVAEALPDMPRPGKGDLQDPAECVREMTEAGFTNVTAEPFTSSIQVAGPEAYLELIIRSGAPFAMVRKKVGEQAWTVMKQKLLDAVKKRLPDGPSELSAEAILTVGTRP